MTGTTVRSGSGSGSGPDLTGTGLVVAGTGTATAPALSRVRPRRRASLYADPLSWLVLEAVERALDTPGAQPVAAAEQIGHIVVSEWCTGHTMSHLAAQIQQGRMSPLRFAGANPGAVCGFTCQVLGFSGPALTLSMAPAEGLAVATTIAADWLRGAAADWVILTAHDDGAPGHEITSTILRRRGQQGP
jgi:hypothetical protein